MSSMRVLTLCLIMATTQSFATASDLFVSPSGDDRADGTIRRPFATIERALAARLERRSQPVTINLRAGTHYLARPVTLTAADSGTAAAPLVIRPYGGEAAVVSGGRKLTLDWLPYRGGIWKADVPEGLVTEELFVNGERQVLARYPNFDANERIFNGFAPDAIAKERVAKWADPQGGYFHAMHPGEWGDYTWRITGKLASGEVALEGGWQNNRPAGPHASHRFVENIFEELDAPGEWFLDHKRHTLYFFPPADLDLPNATVEATMLRSLFEFRGSRSKPVHHVRLKGLVFRHTSRTVMDTREPMLRSDWAIYRGGAVFFEGAEDCGLEDCFLDQVGGNAIFVNRYNRRLTFRSLNISRAGASGIQFAGDPRAARSALFNYDETQPIEAIDMVAGAKSDDYPAECLVDDCLITLTGRTEKQTAGVSIDLAKSITIRNCSIYDMPRAGINIGDGCWGGHVIEGCDIFDTVKETGDHGSFNSWGRDRFWNPDIQVTNKWVLAHPGMPFLDAQQPNILRNNRWRCDHGWDIDLDDGSSNYEIYNNLCLNGGIKNREGYRRVVRNNVLVNNGFHPHVWYQNSGDVFERNIVWRTYAPALMNAKPWPEGLDHNFLQLPAGSALSAPAPAGSLQAQSGQDAASLQGDALFVNPAAGDYRVQRNSPAAKLGFHNFPMDRFGVRSSKLGAIARTPLLSAAGGTGTSGSVRRREAIEWLGANVRNIVGPGEMSAFGTPGETGVLILAVTEKSPLRRAGLQPNDVILSVDGKPVADTASLVLRSRQPGPLRIEVLRLQRRKNVTVGLP